MLKNSEYTKLYYSISEVSEMLGVSNSLIRFWESEFEFLKPKKNTRGDRRYMAKDIDNLKMVHHLVKEKGFTLAGARNAIADQKKFKRQKKATLNKLKEIKKFLVELRGEL